MAWLLGARTAAGLALAAGLIEIGYNAYKWQDSNDPFRKAAYAENVGSGMIDTSLAIASVVFPPLGAALLVWQLERQAFGLVFGKGFAYRVTSSPGRATIHITNEISGKIDSDFMQTSYNQIRSDLISLLETINNTGMPYYPFTALFVDPEDN